MKCAVLCCRNEQSYCRGKAFFKFPRDKVLCKRWLEAIGRMNYIPLKASIVCEDHFNENHINKNRQRKTLKICAIPLHNFAECADCCSNTIRDNISANENGAHFSNALSHPATRANEEDPIGDTIFKMEETQSGNKSGSNQITISDDFVDKVGLNQSIYPAMMIYEDDQVTSVLEGQISINDDFVEKIGLSQSIYPAMMIYEDDQVTSVLEGQISINDDFVEKIYENGQITSASPEEQEEEFCMLLQPEDEQTNLPCVESSNIDKNMVGKEIDPSDIGKHPKIIKAAQLSMSQTDVLVCGKCHSVFHFIELFKEHKEDGCDKESDFRDCRDMKPPKVWAFLLWKATQLNNNDANRGNSWRFYKKWGDMDASVRETWVVAGKTIQSFARMGQGNLQEMPVKITKTVVDNPPKATSTPGKFLGITDSRTINRKEDDPDDPPPVKSEPVKLIRKTVGTPINQPTLKQVTNTLLHPTKSINRRANRTIPNTSGQEFEEETVEKIIAKRFNPRRKMHEYLVKWEGFPHEQNTWEPQTHLECCPQLLETFEKQLARQKEQRAAQAAKQAALAVQQQQQSQQQSTQQQQQQSTGTNVISPVSPTSRPARNSKAKALDQVKQWCADEETNSSSGGGNKRKHEDSDFEDNPAAEAEEDFEDDVIPVHAVKRLKNGNAIAVKVDSKMDVKITSVPHVQSQATIIKAVNGSLTGSNRNTPNDTSADVIVTKDSSQISGIKKTSTSPISSHKTEAQIRVLSKGENTTSGIVRITSASQLTGAQKIATPAIINSSTPVTTTTSTTTPRITQITQRTIQSGNTLITNTVGQAQISQVQTHRIVVNPREKGLLGQQQQHQKLLSTKVANSPTSITGTRTIQSQPKTAIIQRTSLSPNVNQTQSPSSGKMIINRGVKSAPTSKNVTPEQKIIQLSKSGDLKVTRKVITHSPQQQQHKQQQQQQQQQHHQQQRSNIHGTTIKSGETLASLPEDEYPEPQSPPRPLTLCPVTGKVLGQAEGEPAVPSPMKKELIEPGPQSGVFHAQPPIATEQQQQQQQSNEELSSGLTLATEDGQQQILTSEDGTPLLVTGEDGTIYQVAGKNAEGQTILIAQGADGEQQFAYVAAEDGEEGGVLALDNAVAEAVAQMLPEQQAEALAAAAAAGGGETQFIIKQNDAGNTGAVAGEGAADGTQALTIQTGDGGDSQDANIPAEVVQADLPSPGGTRRVVLLLQDGTFMMTEMHDDEYQALNIVT